MTTLHERLKALMSDRGKMRVHVAAKRLGCSPVDLAGPRAQKKLIAVGLRWTYRNGNYWIILPADAGELCGRSPMKKGGR